MRIAYAVAGSEQRAAATQLADLITGFHREAELHLISDHEGCLTTYAAQHSTQCHVAPHLLTRPLSVVSRIARTLAAIRPDIVHTHSPRMGIFTALAARRLGIPVVHTAYDCSLQRSGGQVRQQLGASLDRLGAHLYARMIALSDHERRCTLRYGVAPQRAVTIRPGIAETRWRANPARALVPNFVMIAPFGGHSHHQLLLEAFAGVDVPATLTLLGEGPNLAWMRGLAAKLGINGRVRFGAAPEDPAETLANAHGFVYSGRSDMRESAPCLAQALRAGLPVAATDVGLLHEAVTNGDNGYLCAPGDAEGLRSALRRLAAEPRLRAAMGAESRFRWEQHFSVHQMIEKTETLYDEVCMEAGITPQPRSSRSFTAVGGRI